MFKKLKYNQMGFIHLQLIIVVALVIIGIGAVGSYVVYKSKALSNSTPKLVKLDPSTGPIGTKVKIYGDRLFTGSYKININSVMGTVVATSTDGGKSLSFTFPSTLCPVGMNCAQVVAKPGVYKISVTNNLNRIPENPAPKPSNSLDFKLVENQVHYFEIALRGIPDNNFIIELNKPVDVQHARDLIAGKTLDKTHVAGKFIKQPISYNPKWHFYLDPKTIYFFQVEVEVCDARTTYIEDNLATIFFPNNIWCPWPSYVYREVE